MPHFTLQVTPGGPVLNSLVGVSQARAVALQAAQQPVPQFVKIRALVDTGASCTCLDPSVIQTLGITPKGTVLVNTPSTGASPHPTYEYDVQIIIPPALAAHPPLFLPNIAVAEAQLLLAQGFHALIGRDILNACVLIYNGSTQLFTLAY